MQLGNQLIYLNMKYPFAFIDVDSLELSPQGITYVCHPNVEHISEEIYEVYSIISGVASPLVFSVDINKNIPSEKNKRRDFLTIPVNHNETKWKESVTDWYKFYIQREKHSEKEKLAIFNSNENALECVKLINSKEWIVFGNGIEQSVDHVISTLLDTVQIVKFIPELIVPADGESKELIELYTKKWIDKGAIPITYDDITELARCHQY